MGAKATAAIKEAIADKITDDFESGTVIRWKAKGRYQYAAIRIDTGEWYSTSKYDGVTPARMSFPLLLQVLARPETSEIEVSTGWDPLDT